MGLNNFRTTSGVAEFTDIEVDSLGLPSGYEIDEDNGDLVVRDTTGTVALRRVDGGNWSFAGNTVEANQLGTSANPATVESDNITNSDTITSSVVNTERVVSDVYAEQFNTLQSAINEADSGETVLLGDTTYIEDISINKTIKLVGSTLRRSNIEGDVEINGFQSTIKNIDFRPSASGDKLTISQAECKVIGCGFSVPVEVTAGFDSSIIGNSASGQTITLSGGGRHVVVANVDVNVDDQVPGAAVGLNT
jgi:hypothetical protein